MEHKERTAHVATEADASLLSEQNFMIAAALEDYSSSEALEWLRAVQACTCKERLIDGPNS
jgi:hypothetical protein